MQVRFSSRIRYTFPFKGEVLMVQMAATPFAVDAAIIPLQWRPKLSAIVNLSGAARWFVRRAPIQLKSISVNDSSLSFKPPSQMSSGHLSLTCPSQSVQTFSTDTPMPSISMTVFHFL